MNYWITRGFQDYDSIAGLWLDYRTMAGLQVDYKSMLDYETGLLDYRWIL